MRTQSRCPAWGCRRQPARSQTKSNRRAYLTPHRCAHAWREDPAPESSATAKPHRTNPEAPSPADGHSGRAAASPDTAAETAGKNAPPRTATRKSTSPEPSPATSHARPPSSWSAPAPAPAPPAIAACFAESRKALAPRRRPAPERTAARYAGRGAHRTPGSSACPACRIPCGAGS